MSALSCMSFVDTDARYVWRSTSASGGQLLTAMLPPVCEHDWLADFYGKIESMRSLQDGWNGYSAPRPAEIALSYAEAMLRVLGNEGIAPDRLAPSAIGGVGITFRRGNRKTYIEILNNGSSHLAFVSGDRIETEPARLTDRLSMRSLAHRAFAFLNG